MKLVSRAEWGARPYRTPGGATLYSRARRGVKVHYLGSAYEDRPHTACAAYVRKLQDSHMDGNGWSDIGYSFVVCTHGYVYEGRGLKRRNSANGNTTLNEQDYAVCFLVGSSGLTKPTDAQLDGGRDAIDYCRKEGPAGTWIGGHRDGYATACPGEVLYAWVKKGAPRPASAPVPSQPAPAQPAPTAPVPAGEDGDMPQLLNETNSIDVPVGKDWLGLAFADAVLHTGPRRHTTLVHLLFEEHVPDGTVIEGRFYLTDTAGKNPSAYLPTRHQGGGGHQFLLVGEIPSGKHLRFEVRAITPDGSPVKLLHRVTSGLYWAA
ncbi:N-acetylmuramoyl-L-alanine amidase [Streptomyces sp. NPDC001268]|uniref:N-acetylmuramoyl-L-alanine amidase n=1 Tax=Streptomyces sp. NPDC001268 TaxID=3364553 RepID=UPI0036C89F16